MNDFCQWCGVDSDQDDSVQRRMCGHMLCEAYCFACPLCEQEGATDGYAE